jgi:uncharacterized membrane protein
MTAVKATCVAAHLSNPWRVVTFRIKSRELQLSETAHPVGHPHLSSHRWQTADPKGKMYSDQLHYMPLTWPFFSILIGLFVVLVILIQVQILHFAYMRLGIGSGVALALLLASLLGSYVNIPVAHLPQKEVMSGQEIEFFGMHYLVPMMVAAPQTIIAVNVGGALIPALLSLYLLARNNLWIRGAIATACVALICHLLAWPVPGLGIAIPTFAPPLATAVVSLLIADRNPAAVAYISGSMGTLIGADLLNIGKLQGMGAPVASIGGAGTFDGIFLTGILAVIIASLPFRR